MQTIKQYLTQNNLSMRELARRAEISASNLSYILNGKGRITDRTARKLARAMRLKAWWKLTESGKDN